jgi:hypothetical protein
MLDFLATNLIARTAFLMLVFVIAMMIVLLGMRVASRRAALRSGIRAIAHSGGVASGRMRLQENRDSGWARLAANIEKTGLNLTDTRGDKLREKLIAAGYTSSAQDLHAGAARARGPAADCLSADNHDWRAAAVIRQALSVRLRAGADGAVSAQSLHHRQGGSAQGSDHQWLPRLP